MFLFSAQTMFCILCLWTSTSTFKEFLGGNGMFYAFMFLEIEPVDKVFTQPNQDFRESVSPFF